MLNISWITDKIAIGPAFAKEDLGEIKKKRISAIVDLRSEFCDDQKLIEKLGLKFLHIKIDDRYTPDLKQLKRLFDFVLPLLKEDKKILIYCQNGCGRSPLVAIALLVKLGMGVTQALGLVGEKHPTMGFTPQQEKFVFSLEEELKQI